MRWPGQANKPFTVFFGHIGWDSARSAPYPTMYVLEPEKRWDTVRCARYPTLCLAIFFASRFPQSARTMKNAGRFDRRFSLQRRFSSS
jgi:hypothetical protein